MVYSSILFHEIDIFVESRPPILVPNAQSSILIWANASGRLNTLCNIELKYPSLSAVLLLLLQLRPRQEKTDWWVTGAALDKSDILISHSAYLQNDFKMLEIDPETDGTGGPVNGE